MVKHLFLCRHAQAREALPNQRDFERELSPAGLQEAVRTGEFIKSFNITLDQVFCSAAVRTRQTAQKIAEVIHLDTVKLKPSQDLYDAPASLLLQVVTSLPDSVQAVLLVGHNPGISELVSKLTGNKVYVPTAGCNYFKYQTPDWAALEYSPYEYTINF